MCGRFTLTVPADEIAAALGVFEGLVAGLKPRYNIAPTQQVLALRQTSTDEPPAYTQLRWGLVPFWADDLKIGSRLLNARADTIAEKPAFRAAFKRRRCLIPADGFYEWKAATTSEKQAKKPPKQAYHIRMKERRPFAFAGLWERWDKGETPIETCTIITTEANDVLRPLHDRMPVILRPEDHRRWLSPEPVDPALLLELLRPYANDAMTTVPVSPVVNNSRVDDPTCLDEAWS